MQELWNVSTDFPQYLSFAVVGFLLGVGYAFFGTEGDVGDVLQWSSIGAIAGVFAGAFLLGDI